MDLLIVFIAILNLMLAQFSCRNVLKKNNYEVDFFDIDLSDLRNMRKLKNENSSYTVYYYWLLSSLIIFALLALGLFFLS